MKSEAWQRTLSAITRVALQLLADKIAADKDEAAEMAARIVTGRSLVQFVDSA